MKKVNVLMHLRTIAMIHTLITLIRLNSTLSMEINVTPTVILLIYLIAIRKQHDKIKF